MERIPTRIIEKVDGIIKRYSLFDKNEVCVAYSGGKDSLFLCLVLKELGYQVFPVIIDIGYNSDWGIAEKNIKQMGIDSVIIGVDQINKLMPDLRDELQENLRNIKKISKGSFRKATICTPCHNSKMLILQRWAELNTLHYIANGHHAIDSISSLLKSFYMYLDRWEYNHEEFVYNNFYNLILSQKKIYTLEKEEFVKNPLYSKIEKQIAAQNAGTDEPVLQYMANSSIQLCRPLFNVFECEIIKYFENQNIQFNESECYITKYRDKRHLTPRELVQFELLKDSPLSLLELLLSLTKLNLDDNGFLKYNVRNNRKMILGNGYKNEQINNIKR